MGQLMYSIREVITKLLFYISKPVKMEGKENLEGQWSTPKSYTQEEFEAKVKEMQSNSEKGVQKLIWEKKEILDQKEAYDEVFNYLTDVSENPEKLVDLYEEKPEVAQIILDKYYNSQSIEDFKEGIEYKADYTDPVQIQKQIDKWVERKLNETLIKKEKANFIKELKLKDEEIVEFEKAFTERKELKSFSLKNLTKTLEKSYRDIDGSSENMKDYKKSIDTANLMATGWNWWTTPKWQTSFEKSKSDARAFLAEHL